ncbi:sigma-70 family RNA polymerase sigma factor, partial [Chitinophaga sp.]|uniref:RNA polymerase sigma factor n=1 Tax=Chitinophaga sp. TaxID=1869181 RepID=UPI002F940067
MEQLRNEDSSSFERLYHHYYASIATYITHHFGTAADAEDIFQETMIVFLQKIRQPEFILSSSLKTYLFAIARNLWLKKLRDNKLVPVEDLEKYCSDNEALTFELQPPTDKAERMMTWLTKISANCQRILKALFFYKEPMGSLMKKMGWKNKHTAANQQYKCIQQVKKEKNNAPMNG